MDEKYSDFEEITLAITLLAALSAFLLKLIDYFNINSIDISTPFQKTINVLVFISLIEIFIILFFLMVKGYLISVKNQSKNLILFSKILFGCIFIYSILYFIISIMMLFFFIFFGTSNGNPNNNYVFFGYIGLVIITVAIIASKLGINLLIVTGLHNSWTRLDYFIISIFAVLVFFIFLILSVASSYLLMGSYSIDVFPQSNTNDDILTFTITETGIPYDSNWITLFKLNSTSNFKQIVDRVTINRTNEKLSDNEFMLGENIYGIWYLNINSSNLQSGTYLLHAEVTNEPSSRFFGKAKKRADKLFYIPPKGIIPFNSMKASKNSTN